MELRLLPADTLQEFYTVEELVDNELHNEKAIFFYWGPFDQWFPAPFTLEGNSYDSVEHWMMAEKARFFGDQETLQLILAAPSAEEAKALGRQVRGFDAVAWAKVARDVVFRGNVEKFSLPLFREFLLGTTGITLIEASPTDCIWGIGLASDDDARFSRQQWRGRNWLGEVLMAVRMHLNLGGALHELPADPAHPLNPSAGAGGAGDIALPAAK